MQRHPYFNIQLHDDDELGALLGSAVVERATLHEWPLSCVQRVRLADGRVRIYKAQAPPTVEPEFYARARSPLLIAARSFAAGEGPAALVLDEIDAPKLADLRLPEREAVRLGEEVVAAIGRIAGEPPVHIDIGDEARWAAYAEALLADLAALVAGGAFARVGRAQIARLARLVEDPDVLATFRSPVGYAHRDLNGGNLFVTPDGYRVIDWQRPIRGPVLLDLESVLRAAGHKPLRHVGVGIVRLRDLLAIGWVVECALRWFPAGAAAYDAHVARAIARATRARTADAAGLP